MSVANPVLQDPNEGVHSSGRARCASPVPAARVPDGAPATAREAAELTSSSTPGTGTRPIILSFDVEEHHRIEAAVGLEISPDLKAVYRERMRDASCYLLEELDRRGVRATFFVVGEIARHSPELIRAMHDAGHEVACHGWDHRRIIGMTPADFRENLRRGREALEDTIGAAVVGFRAPTFSITRETSWAIDILVDQGFVYDSSIYPVRHDRYGIPNAPRGPFLVEGPEFRILELPPATLRLRSLNLPVGGGGYFRLLPGRLTRFALSRWQRDPDHESTSLYFHPWEFDPDQPRLPLTGMNRFRTYVGLRTNRRRFEKLLDRFAFTRAIDVAERLRRDASGLGSFNPAADRLSRPTRGYPPILDRPIRSDVATS